MEALILSMALDTNGQNARFAAAASRWGSDPIVLRALALSERTDPAGVVGRFVAAAERSDTGLRIRSASRNQTTWGNGIRAGFPTDIVWTHRSGDLVKLLAQEADVVHLNNSEKAATSLHLRKPMLLHHHGGLFRMDPPRMHRVAAEHRMIQAVSTIDLLRHGPPGTLHWLPSAYDVDELLDFGQRNRREPDGRIRIVHAPTNRSLKGTDVFLAAIAELQAEGLPIDLVMVEGRTWQECLEEKARADIVFDQITLGYGCNSIEAWAMGIPVIGGADEWTIRRMRKEFGETPFLNATAKSLKAQLKRLTKSADLRAEYAERGLAHVRRYHDERPALARLAELYAMAIKHYRPSRLPVPLVTFSNPRRKLVAVTAQSQFDIIVWGRDARLTTGDPFVVERLREVIRTKPHWGIREESAA